KLRNVDHFGPSSCIKVIVHRSFSFFSLYSKRLAYAERSWMNPRTELTPTLPYFEAIKAPGALLPAVWAALTRLSSGTEFRISSKVLRLSFIALTRWR